MEKQPIDVRPFGRTGIHVSALGMGCSRLGAFWQHRSDRDGLDAVAEAIGFGISFFDTADAYARGRSERLLGRALRGRRDRAIIATKCGLLRTPASLLNALTSSSGQGRPGARQPAALARSASHLISARRCYFPDYIRLAAEASLRRLGTDRIDILLLHSPSEDVLPRIEVADAFARLKEGGKIRLWGVSVRSTSDATLAMALPGIDCLELELNMCRPGAMERVVPETEARGLGIIARQPFGSGALLARATRPKDDGRPHSSLRVEGMMDRVKACLQFTLDTPGVATVIAGMTRPSHVQANVRAVTSERLTGSQIEEIHQALCN
jgi:aryl-alcohol dehydrogenase-like predicted oxidoreductase